MIASPGTWCLRHDVSTPQSTGVALKVEANNVTIDCNGFRFGGLAAGAGTQTVGIGTESRLNTTVRGCHIRGFLYGVRLLYGGGHLVEDSRVEASTTAGILVWGDGSMIRGNRIFDTGGTTVTANLGGAAAIQALGTVDVLDNTIVNVVPSATGSGYAEAMGIATYSGQGSTVTGNRVRGLVKQGAAVAYGIYINNADRSVVADNHVMANGDGSAGTGVFCLATAVRAIGNVVVGFTTPMSGCVDAGNSL